MKTKERREMGVRRTKYTEQAGSFAEVSYKEFVVWFKRLWLYEVWRPFRKENQMYQWKIYANSAIFSKCCFESNSVILGRRCSGEGSWGIFKNAFDPVLQTFADVLKRGRSWDQYFVSKKSQNQEWLHHYSQKAVGFPISDSCFKLLKKARLFSPGVLHVQAQGSPSTVNRDELLLKAPLSLAPKSHK